MDSSKPRGSLFLPWRKGSIAVLAEHLSKLAGGDFTVILTLNRRAYAAVTRAINALTDKVSSILNRFDNGVGNLSAHATEIGTIAQVFTANSENTLAKSNMVAAAAEEMTINMASVAASIEQTSTNLNAIAAATEEMNANIKNIVDNSSRARTISHAAVQGIQSDVDQVGELSRAAAEIGEITETISAISKKTNLLALNATIEAARAGEAGKGFAVVANEIKDLATQAASATADINRKLRAIQLSAAGTESGIDRIAGVITQLDGIFGEINSSLEQQNATTAEIAENISQTSSGLQVISDNVSQASAAAGQVSEQILAVNRAAGESTSSSAELGDGAKALGDLAARLQQELRQYRFEAKGFAAGPVKQAHAVWKKRVADLLAGRAPLKPEEVTDHHVCAFGKWYFSEGMECFQDLRTFREIDQHHARVHSTAREIARLYNNGEYDQAHGMFKEFQAITATLFSLLEQLERETN